MADNKPTPWDGKAYIAPAVIALVIIAIFAVFLFRQPSTPVPQPVPQGETPILGGSIPQPAAKLPPAAPAPPPPILTRVPLIDAARSAAAAFAEQNTLDGASAGLIGRRFLLRVPFNCGGTQSSLAQASVSMDTSRQSITVSARPSLWTSLPLFEPLFVQAIEAIEGFWIPRPWSNAESCPPRTAYPVPATPTPPSSPTVGIAQIFTTADSRVRQHADRPYEFTRKIPPNDSNLLDHSYRLVLEGRITGYEDGQALRCWMESPDHRPICVFAVTLDRVAFEDGTTGEVLANWND